MTEYTCEHCKKEEATHFGETIRTPSGSGTIKNLGDRCWHKLQQGKLKTKN